MVCRPYTGFSLRLAVLNVFQGLFRPKMAVFGRKLQFLNPRSSTCESLFLAATVLLLAETFSTCTSLTEVSCTKPSPES